jgi:O-antigen ligase
MNKRISFIVLILFFSVLFLLPFSRLSELPILILSILGLTSLFTTKTIFQSNRFKILTTVYLCYLVMILVSALDSYWPQKSFLVGLASLRFYLASCALLAYLKQKHFIILINLISYFIVFLAVDALFQYFAGFDLIGRYSYPGRLNGMFGEHHAKLGPLLALFFPIVLISLQNKKPLIRWLAVFVVSITILLSGTRSAWIMLLFTVFAYFFYHVKQKRILLLIKSSLASILLIICLWFISADFQQRIQRSLAVFQGTEKSLDFALADRLPIWESSINMIKKHPINGVGAHAFRKAYPEFAEKDDVWQKNGGVGMHAHHWILEVLSETGLIGLMLILFAIIKLFQFLKPFTQSKYTWAFGIALISAFLPITSSYSIFASFWSICIWIVGIGLILVSVKDE